MNTGAELEIHSARERGLAASDEQGKSRTFPIKPECPAGLLLNRYPGRAILFDRKDFARLAICVTEAKQGVLAIEFGSGSSGAEAIDV